VEEAAKLWVLVSTASAKLVTLRSFSFTKKMPIIDPTRLTASGTPAFLAAVARPSAQPRGAGFQRFVRAGFLA